MKKLNFYGMELAEGGKRFLHRFPFKKDLHAWVKKHPYFTKDALGRYEEYATDPLVRRTLRRMAQDSTLTFPVEVL